MYIKLGLRLQNLQVLINFDVRNKHRKRGRERCIKCKKSGCWCQAHIQSICIRTVSFFYVIVHYFISGWSGEKIKCYMYACCSVQISCISQKVRTLQKYFVNKLANTLLERSLRSFLNSLLIKSLIDNIFIERLSLRAYCSNIYKVLT